MDGFKRYNNNIQFIISDNAGWKVTSDVFFSIFKDEPDPAIETLPPANAEKDFEDWHKEPPEWLDTVSINCYDTGYLDIISIAYQVYSFKNDTYTQLQIVTDDGYLKPEWLNGIAIDWDKLQNGTNDIWIEVKDRALNKTRKKEFSILKDIKPEIHKGILGADIWYKEKNSWMESIPITFNDFGSSNIKQIYYYISANSVKSETAEIITINAHVEKYKEWSISWRIPLDNGTNNIEIWIFDNADGLLISDNILKIKKDEMPPSFIVREPQDASFTDWYNAAPLWLNKVDIDISDEGYSKISTISYKVHNYKTNVTSGWQLVTDNYFQTSWLRGISINWIYWKMVQMISL